MLFCYQNSFFVIKILFLLSKFFFCCGSLPGVHYRHVCTSARTRVKPGLNSDIASPHSTHFLRNRVEPGFSQPTYVCGFKWVETGSRMARFVHVHQERFSSDVALSTPIIWQQALVLSFALAVLKLPRLFKFTELALTRIECGRVLTEFNPDRFGLPSTRINPVS